MSKVIAIATADWHLHKFRDFDDNGSRLNYSLAAAKEIMKIAKGLTVPILFAGDLIHSPKNIETETNIKVQRLFDTYLCTEFIAISGNHDMSERNTLESKSPSHLESILVSKLTLLGNGLNPIRINGILIWGISYFNNDQDLKNEVIRLRQSVKLYEGEKSLRILLLHTDMPGAKTPEGFTLGEVPAIPNNLDKFFKDWDLVLCGHIHKPQKLSKKVYMLGCPIQQNIGNRHDDLGYWEVYDDATMKFIPMDNYPKFIKLKKGEDPKDNFNYYIPFEAVVEESEVITGEFNINYSKKRLATTYLKKKNIKSKSKRRALIKILNEE